MRRRKHPFKMSVRVARLLLTGRQTHAPLVTRSYDRISAGYDQAWTHHMRHLTDDLVDRLEIGAGQAALDLTCGTGYATGRIATLTGCGAVGVDASRGMLAQARDACAGQCTFVHADVLAYLKTVSDATYDRVTCCWGLGYSQPLSVLRQIRRVLKPGGKVGVIDNTLFSLREVLWASVLAFMEQPEKLEHVMAFRFLSGHRQLRLWYRLARLKPACTWGGAVGYSVGSGAEAIQRLRETGAAAGFEYAAGDRDASDIFGRFAEILERRHRKGGALPIIHRYLAGIATK